MFNPLFNGLLLLFVGYYAYLSGRSDERTVAVICILTSVALIIVGIRAPLASATLTLAVLDVLALVGYTIVALRSERFWPLWVAGLQLGNLLSQVVTNRHLATESDASPLEPHLWLYLIALIIAIGTWRGARRPASKRQLVNWNLRNWLGPSEADDSAQIDRGGTVDIPAALHRTYGIADPDPPSKAPGWHAHPRPGILDDGRPQRIEKWNRLAAGPEALRIEHRRGRAENRRNDLPDRGNGSGVDHPPLDTDEFRTDEHAALRSKR